MKISIERSKFQTALNTVKDVIGGAELPILQNVKMETLDGNKLKLTTTNLDQTISTTVDCAIEETGSTTVPAKLIVSMVGALTSPMVSFKHETGNSKAVLTGGDVTYKICTLPVEQFPIPAGVKGDTIEFTQAEFKEMLRKASYAASLDTTRRTLVGVCLQNKDGFLYAISTDGRRLACAKVAKTISGELSAILPNNSVKTIQRLLGNEGNVNITIDVCKAVRLTADSWTLQTKLIDDEYPNWRQVIPADTLNKVKIDRTALIDAVRQVSLASGTDNTHIVMDFKNGVLTLSASTENVSDASAMLTVKYDAEEVKVTLNPHYLTDVLAAFDEDEISFNFNNGAQPVTLTNDKDNALAVIMPLRVN